MAHPILRRWLDVVLYALFSVFVMQLLLPLLREPSEGLAARFAVFGYALDLLGILVVVLVPLLLFSLLFCGVRTSHLLNSWRYPSLFTAVILGVLGHAGLRRYAAAPGLAGTWMTVAVLLGYVLLVVLLDLARGFLASNGGSKFCTGHRPPRDAPDKSASVAKGAATMQDDGFKTWLLTEEPIRSTQHDRLGFDRFAKSVASRFKSQPEVCIGIVGSYGSGKTSLANLVGEHLRAARNPRFLLVPVSCWGFDSAKKAEEEIVSSMVSALNEHVDCFAIRRLPRDYVRSMSAGNSWVDSLLRIAARCGSAEEQLSRITPALAAIETQLVVILEDIDRTSPSFAKEEVLALAWRLRSVRHVSLVVSANRFSPSAEAGKDQGTGLDMHKLCDYIYDIGIPNVPLWLEMVKKSHSLAGRISAGDVPAGRRQQRDHSDVWGRDDSAMTSDTWLNDLVGTVDSVRQLKSALRRAIGAWESIHGEADFEELLVLSVLRASCPQAFDLVRELLPIQRSQARLVEMMLDKNQNRLKETVSTAWEKHVGDSHPKASSVRNLVGALLPKVKEPLGGKKSLSREKLKAQTICSSEPTDYWNRILGEEVPAGELRDQVVLQAIVGWLEQPVETNELPRKLATDEEWAAKFEQFGALVGDDEQLLALASQHLAQVRDRYKEEAGRDAPGFIPMLRTANTHSDLRDGRLLPWIRNEISAAIGTSLKLVCDIYQHWACSRGTIVFIPPELRREARRHMLDCAREMLSGEGGAKRLLTATPRFVLENQVLNRLVRDARDKVFEKDGVWGPEAWSFAADAILGAVELEPSKMIPHVILLLAHFGGVQAPLDAGYKLERTVYEPLFGDKTSKLMDLLAGASDVDESLPDEVKACIRKARDAAKAWVAGNRGAEE